TGVLPFPRGSFDVVTSTEVVEHLRAPFLVLTEMVRVLKVGGLLVLTIPNYWNIHYRVRYLLSGNFQRTKMDNPPERDLYLRGAAPHIVILPYPTLRCVLTWEGCGDFQLRHRALFGFFEKLLYLPALLPIRLRTLLAGARSRERYFLDETNGPSALFG